MNVNDKKLLYVKLYLYFLMIADWKYACDAKIVQIALRDTRNLVKTSQYVTRVRESTQGLQIVILPYERVKNSLESKNNGR